MISVGGPQQTTVNQKKHMRRTTILGLCHFWSGITLIVLLVCSAWSVWNTVWVESVQLGTFGFRLGLVTLRLDHEALLQDTANLYDGRYLLPWVAKTIFAQNGKPLFVVMENMCNVSHSLACNSLWWMATVSFSVFITILLCIVLSSFGVMMLCAKARGKLKGSIFGFMAMGIHLIVVFLLFSALFAFFLMNGSQLIIWRQVLEDLAMHIYNSGTRRLRFDYEVQDVGGLSHDVGLALGGASAIVSLLPLFVSCQLVEHVEPLTAAMKQKWVKRHNSSEESELLLQSVPDRRKGFTVKEEE